MIAPTAPDGINRVTVSWALDWPPEPKMAVFYDKRGEKLTVIWWVTRWHVIVAETGEHLNLAWIQTRVETLLGH